MTLPLTWCIAALVCTNALAFCAQWIDKRRAIAGAWRIRERTLLLLGVPLAAPGMLLGMCLFAHKTRKVSFLVKAGAVLLCNLALGSFVSWAWVQGIVRFV
ncbi:hypothetical protein PLCT2_01503 [Planctomycetaceae bacterium]|nr:hypothetical protein PLCT2_01503 [Planctomycetaceae bacterium]